MKKLIKPLWLALATLSALLTVVSCVKDLKPQEQEVNFDLLLTSDQSQINQDQQSVANQITITEEKVDCPRPTKYSVSFTYDETVGSLLFLGEPVQSGKPFALSSLSNLTLTYQAKKLADNKVNIVVSNDAPKKLSKELVWSILADEFYRVTVEHEGEGSVTVTGADNLSAVKPDTKLSVTAEPAEGWKLTSLTANDVDILNDKSFVVTENTTVRAVFTTEAPETYAVTLEKEGEGKVDITGADNLSAVVTGTKLTVSAEPASGWRLVSMTANGEDILSSKSFVVKGNTTVKVVFTTEAPETYAVTLEKEGEGKVDITGADNLSAVVTGTKLTVTAIPANGWEISSMTANGVDILSSKSFVVKGNTTVKVVFKKQPPKTYAVTLVKEGEGKVDITGANDLGAVVTGTKLTVTAVPANGWEISSMTANGVDILSSKSFVVKGNTTVKVTFKQKLYKVTLVYNDGHGVVKITGADNLDAVVKGTKLTVSAEPFSGWKLVSMTANGVDILSSKSFVVTENTTVEVVFEMTSKKLKINLVQADIVPQYLKSPKLGKYVRKSTLDLVQKYLPKVVTDKGEELTPSFDQTLSQLGHGEWTLHYGSIPIGTKVSFILDEAAMSPLVATLSKGEYIGGKNYANQSFVIEKTLWETDEFTLYYSLAEGFAYFAYPSQTQTSSEHGYINVKPPYRPFRVLARYGGESTDIPPYEIVAVPTQSQVEITPIGLAGWAYNGLRLTELDAK